MNQDRNSGMFWVCFPINFQLQTHIRARPQLAPINRPSTKPAPVDRFAICLIVIWKLFHDSFELNHHHDSSFRLKGSNTFSKLFDNFKCCVSWYHMESKVLIRRLRIFKSITTIMVAFLNIKKELRRLLEMGSHSTWFCQQMGYRDQFTSTEYFSFLISGLYLWPLLHI